MTINKKLHTYLNIVCQCLGHTHIHTHTYAVVLLHTRNCIGFICFMFTGSYVAQQIGPNPNWPIHLLPISLIPSSPRPQNHWPAPQWLPRPSSLPHHNGFPLLHVRTR